MKTYYMKNGLSFIYDEQDSVLINSHTWSCLKKNKSGYPEQPATSIKVNDRYIRVRLTSLLFGIKDGMFIDHIDKDPLNNCRSNLRWCTISENNRNRRRHKRKSEDYTNNYKGVTFLKSKLDKPWQSRIGINDKRIFLGYFKTEEEAARAYDEAAKKHHGEFASLNFNEEWVSVAK